MFVSGTGVELDALVVVGNQFFEADYLDLRLEVFLGKFSVEKEFSEENFKKEIYFKKELYFKKDYFLASAFNAIRTASTPYSVELFRRFVNSSMAKILKPPKLDVIDVIDDEDQSSIASSSSSKSLLTISPSKL